MKETFWNFISTKSLLIVPRTVQTLRVCSFQVLSVLVIDSISKKTLSLETRETESELPIIIGQGLTGRVN